MTQVSGNPDVPGMGRRQFMNFLAFGAVTGTALGALYPVVRYFVPPKPGGPGAGTTAKDELGSPVVASDFLANNQPDARVLVQGMKGDPTYLVVDDDQTLKNYGLNAVCTHLGCVVPWEAAQDKFICPCHGSQYDREGKVIRGPAPLSLALVDVDVNQDEQVVLKDWEDTDFRTGKEPWWIS